MKTLTLLAAILGMGAPKVSTVVCQPNSCTITMNKPVKASTVVNLKYTDGYRHPVRFSPGSKDAFITNLQILQKDHGTLVDVNGVKPK